MCVWLCIVCVFACVSVCDCVHVYVVHCVFVCVYARVYVWYVCMCACVMYVYVCVCMGVCVYIAHACECALGRHHSLGAVSLFISFILSTGTHPSIPCCPTGTQDTRHSLRFKNCNCPPLRPSTPGWERRVPTCFRHTASPGHGCGREQRPAGPAAPWFLSANELGE